MTTITVELEDNLSANQVSKIKDLLILIRGVARISGAGSHQLATLMPPESDGFSNLTQRQAQPVSFDSINPRQKKYIISQAIAWGSKHGKITLNSLQRLNPEEIMNLATSFLSEMSDHERDNIFREIS